jgi:hypothetical protein
MRKLLLVLILIIFISNVSASCEEDQIDINTASAEKLDEIIHVGPAVAGYIIDARPFDSLDELVNVSYISAGYLEDIIEQGLACVNGQEEEEEEIIEEEEEQEQEEEEENVVEEYQEIEEEQEIKEPVSRETEPIELQTINLNPKVIKTEDDNENLSKNDYAIYGLVFFCVLLVVLFILRKNKYNKNEFR